MPPVTPVNMDEIRAPVNCITCGLEIQPDEVIRRPARNVETGEFGFVYEHVGCAIQRRREYDANRAAVIRKARIRLIISLLALALYIVLWLWMLGFLHL